MRLCETEKRLHVLYEMVFKRDNCMKWYLKRDICSTMTLNLACDSAAAVRGVVTARGWLRLHALQSRDSSGVSFSVRCDAV